MFELLLWAADMNSRRKLCEKIAVTRRLKTSRLAGCQTWRINLKVSNLTRYIYILFRSI
jgi:hypothetical protein